AGAVARGVAGGVGWGGGARGGPGPTGARGVAAWGGWVGLSRRRWRCRPGRSVRAVRGGAGRRCSGAARRVVVLVLCCCCGGAVVVESGLRADWDKRTGTKTVGLACSHVRTVDGSIRGIVVTGRSAGGVMGWCRRRRAEVTARNALDRGEGARVVRTGR